MTTGEVARLAHALMVLFLIKHIVLLAHRISGV
jgi:hypothetical protein